MNEAVDFNNSICDLVYKASNAKIPLFREPGAICAPDVHE